MVNPYFCYALSFLTALLTYLLGWSELYPPLSFALFSFVLLSIVTHVVLGLRLSRKKTAVFKNLEISHDGGPLLVTSFLYLLWSMEFVYEGGVPLLKILLHQPYNYRLFGIPSLHVFVVTFSSFYTIYLFHRYLSAPSHRILFLYFLNLIAAILIYSRAMFFFNLSASFFLFVLTKHKLPGYLVFIVPVSIVILFFVFGALGTLRVSRESKKEYDNTLFMEIGKAKPSFAASFVPKEFFWTYIYMSSPLANLQENINTYPVKAPTFGRFCEMINNELVMDFISKRVNAFLHLEREKENDIPGPFNVSTVYSRSYSYLGWFGMIIMALAVILAPIVYFKLIPANSPFFLSGFVILCTMFLFLAYDNTLRFTGLSFQLVYPVALNFAIRKSSLMKKLFC